MKNKLNLSLFGILAALMLTLSSCANDREKFTGVFSVNDACTSGNYSFQITVAESSTSDETILITNFGGFQTPLTVTATVSGDNITIPNQTVSGVAVSGSGTLNGNILTIVYTTTIGGNTDNCTSTCTKQ